MGKPGKVPVFTEMAKAYGIADEGFSSPCDKIALFSISFEISVDMIMVLKVIVID